MRHQMIPYMFQHGFFAPLSRQHCTAASRPAIHTYFDPFPDVGGDDGLTQRSRLNDTSSFIDVPRRPTLESFCGTNPTGGKDAPHDTQNFIVLSWQSVPHNEHPRGAIFFGSNLIREKRAKRVCSTETLLLLVMDKTRGCAARMVDT